MASERLSRHIERLLDEADEALTQRRWDVVQERAQDILSIHPENSEGVAFLAAAERALGSSGAATEGPALAPSPAAPSTSSSPVQPTSFANGRYEVKRFLGEGGKKKVYLAQDTLLDREVAFALIKTEGPPGSPGYRPSG